MDAVEYLKGIALFADLTSDEAVDVLRIARITKFSPGEYLCRAGESGTCMFVIESGKAAIQVPRADRTSLEVAHLGRGEVLGELALVDGETRSADVVATEELSAYRLERTDFDRMRAELHPAAYKILRRIATTVSGRLREINSLASQGLEQSGPQETRSEAKKQGVLNKLFGRFGGA